MFLSFYLVDRMELSSTLIQVLVVIGLLIVALIGLALFTPSAKPMSIRFFDGTLVGGNTQTFYQDPKLKNAKTIWRSENQNGGVEMTYEWWMMVNQYPSNDSNIVFIKGDPAFNSSDKKNKVYAPLVELQNKNGSNEMHVTFNTYASEDEVIIIPNMPIANWVHCAIIVKNQALYVYINGKLVKSQKFTGVIRQNYGNLVVGPNRGFSGMIADLTYHREALSPSDIASHAGGAPNKKIIGVSQDLPPYISKSWYLGGGDVDYIST